MDNWHWSPYGAVEVPCEWPKLPERELILKSICNRIYQFYCGSPVFQLDGPDEHNIFVFSGVTSL